MQQRRRYDALGLPCDLAVELARLAERRSHQELHTRIGKRSHSCQGHVMCLRSLLVKVTCSLTVRLSMLISGSKR